MIMFYWDNDAM